jgi:hypothetical protein
VSIERCFEHALIGDCPSCGGTGVGTDESGVCYGPGCAGGRVSWFEDRPEPPDESRAFFGAREEILARVEALASEAQQRFEPWGAKPCVRSSFARKAVPIESLFVPYASWSLEYALVEALADRRARVRSFDGHLERLGEQLAEAVRRDLLVPPRCTSPEWKIPASAAGRGFRELPDPVAPMKAIWELGFALTECSERMCFWARD